MGQKGGEFRRGLAIWFEKFVALNSKQKILNFRKIFTPKILGCYNGSS
jgi:hypothetical protein